MKIMDLSNNDTDRIIQTAKLLSETFEAWPTIEIACAEVMESFEDGRISRVLLQTDGTVMGWIGGQSQYSGNVWELHPLVVQETERGKGWGRLLVQDLEEQVRRRGGVTIILGTDDEYNQTNLSNKDLYADITASIKEFQSPDHPAKFYMKMGFTIVGVIPDANGMGKPDILMAKRVRTAL